MNNEKLQYQIIESNVFAGEESCITTFGIELKQNDKIISSVNDISTNMKALESFVTTLNEEQLDPLHLWEVIEDCLDELI